MARTSAASCVKRNWLDASAVMLVERPLASRDVLPAHPERHGNLSPVFERANGVSILDLDFKWLVDKLSTHTPSPSTASRATAPVGAGPSRATRDPGEGVPLLCLSQSFNNGSIDNKALSFIHFGSVAECDLCSTERGAAPSYGLNPVALGVSA